ncbi:MAG TPA: hypothetical protein PLW10_23730, partial [Myxococcota bacterium]|nr:hypothetical protein [Myxococcota bacterium]
TQVVSLDLVENLEPEEIPLRYRDHALFAAFAPVESPEIVVVAVGEHAGGGGGAIAAPMVQKVMARYFEKKEQQVPTQVATIAMTEPDVVGASARASRRVVGAGFARAPRGLDAGALP